MPGIPAPAPGHRPTRGRAAVPSAQGTILETRIATPVPPGATGPALPSRSPARADGSPDFDTRATTMTRPAPDSGSAGFIEAVSSSRKRIGHVPTASRRRGGDARAAGGHLRAHRLGGCACSPPLRVRDAALDGARHLRARRRGGQQRLPVPDRARIVALFERSGAREGQRLRMPGVDGQRAQHQCLGFAGQPPPADHRERVRVVGQQLCVVRAQRRRARVCVHRLRVLAQGRAGTREHDPAVEVIGLLAQTAGEALDHCLDLLPGQRVLRGRG